MINIDEINKQKEARKARGQEDKLNNDNRLTSYPPDICSSYRQALREIKEIVTDAESKLHCVCDITDMLVNIEGKISEVLNF